MAANTVRREVVGNGDVPGNRVRERKPPNVTRVAEVATANDRVGREMSVSSFGPGSLTSAEDGTIVSSLTSGRPANANNMAKYSATTTLSAALK